MVLGRIERLICCCVFRGESDRRYREGWLELRGELFGVGLRFKSVGVCVYVWVCVGRVSGGVCVGVCVCVCV